MTSTSGQSWRSTSRASERVSIRSPAIDRDRIRAYTCASQNTTPVTSTVTAIVPAFVDSYSRDTAITDTARISP